MKRRHINPMFLVAAYVVLDGLCIGISYLLAIALTRPDWAGITGQAAHHIRSLLVFLAVWYCAAIDQKLIVSRRGEALLAQLASATRALIITLVVSVAMITNLVQTLDRSFVALFGLGTLISILLYRTILRFSLWGLRRRGFNTKRILIIGANEATRDLVEVIYAHEQFGYNIVGLLEDDKERVSILEKYGIPYLGPVEELERTLAGRVVDEVYISLPVRSLYETIQRVTHLCEGVGVSVRLIADLFPLRTSTSYRELLEDIPLLSLVGVPGTGMRPALKRLEDIVLSTILLVVLSPLLVSMAAAIKLTSKGPVFVRQTRLGRKGQSFELVRFRCRAVSPGGEGEEPEQPFTWLGRYLEQYDLDELPELLNVWVGQMSLRGPRPIRIHDMKQEVTGGRRYRVDTGMRPKSMPAAPEGVDRGTA